MTRIFILLFVLNTLLPSVGFTAMLSADTNMMSQNHSMMAMDHCSNMDMDASDNTVCDNDTMSNDMCKAKCASSCVSSSTATHISSFSFDIPFVSQKNQANIKLPSLYSRSTPPELRPPLA